MTVQEAIKSISDVNITRWATLKGCVASCAIEGNTYAQELVETMRRLESKEEVGERYLIQLAEYCEAVKG